MAGTVRLLKRHAAAAATPARRAAAPGAAIRYTTPTSAAGRPDGCRGKYDAGNNPKMPLTLMRSVLASVSRDRSEIKEARQDYLVGDSDGDGGG